ncbi:SDR family oxidoreductase [Candidatus Bathyarchaeota archaeon]|nr:SDR family oxidoreductase [Candidatus Bathyarchaeota archaeon]
MARSGAPYPRSLSELISLDGKKALITGSASGIGKAIAYRFAEADARLELADINKEGLEALKEELSERNVNINIHKIDLLKKTEINSLWEKLDGNEPDILVNNAGIYPFKNFLEVDEPFLSKVMDLNLTSCFWMCQNMINRRLKRGRVIINIGSIEAILPFKNDLTHYDISKAGVITMTRALAKEYGKHDFRINAIVPDGIMTPGTKSAAKSVLKLNLGIIKSGLEFRSRLPLGRFGKPDEVALIAVVLANDISSYVHGTVLPVDGGFLSA